MFGFIFSLLIGALAGSIAGRIMGRRIMGSASFFELQDHTGRIQVYIRRDDIVGLSATGLVGEIIVSVIGACVCIWAGRKLFK